MEIVIKKASENNIIAIAELTSEFFPYMAMNADKVYERMKQGVTYLVAQNEEGKTIGFVDYEIIEQPGETHPLENQKTAKILGMCVAERYQGHGIGRNLLERVLQEVEGNARQIILLVEKENTKAISLYEKYGFHLHGKLQRPLWNKEIMMMVKKI